MADSSISGCLAFPVGRRCPRWLFQALNFIIQLFQPVIQKRSILIKVQGHFQQSVKFLLGLLQLLLQIRLYAFAGLDAMQDAIDLGGNFIGEVCRQTLYRFQNGTMQFFFREGRRAAAEFRSVLDAVYAPPDDLLSAVNVPSHPLVRAAAVTADQPFGQGVLAVIAATAALALIGG